MVTAAWLQTAEPGVAQAQADAPHGFVEPCTVGNAQEMDTDCELCSVTTGAPHVCRDRLGTKGYTKKCRTRGTQAGWGDRLYIHRTE